MTVVPDVASGAPPTRIKRRRWYLAALLSILWPGLGHLYNGQPRRALGFCVCVVGVYVSFIVLTHLVGYAFMVWLAVIGLVPLLVLVALVAIIDAGWQASRLKQIQLRRYNRVWVYLLVIVAYGALGGATRFTGAASYNLPGGSMIPTGLVGDVFVAEKGYFLRHAPERGELALFKLPSDPRVDYIKRVVGLPGDTIQIRAGRLHINGVAVARERIDDDVETRGATVRIPQYIETLPGGRRYRIREERGDEGMLDNTAPYIVPASHYFVLGDNRDNSQDSRVLSEVGFIPRANFRDRPAYIYWSRDWSRIGLHLE